MKPPLLLEGPKAPAPAVEALLAELVAEGTLHSEGSFTLDREKAREKMRQFQLADPLEYLLQLVRAAVLQGATALEFSIDTDDMWLSFDGKPFTIKDFDELYGALFGRADDASLAARRHLALGVNAALALRPRHLRIESGEAHLVVRPEEDDTFGPLSPAHPKTRIHVRDRFRLSHFGRFFQASRGALPERTLLAARAAYCPVPLTVNATRLDTGLEQLRQRTVTWVELAEGPHRVVGGHGHPATEPETDQVVLVTAGVTVRTRTLATGDGFTAMATAQGLRTDVSQADVVQDDVLRALLAVVERARLRSLGQLLEVSPEQAPLRLRRELEQAGPPQGWPAHYGQALTAMLRALPIWPTLGGALLSTDALLEDDNFSLVSHALESQFAALGLKPEGEWAQVLLLPDPPLPGHPPPAGRALFRRWFEARQRDRTAALERFLNAEKNRRTWRRRLVDVRLPEEGQLARQDVEVGAIFGEIALHPSLSDRAVLRFAVQGCLLAEHTPPCPLLGFEALIHGPFQPTDLFDDIVRDATHGAALDALAAATPALLVDLTRRTPAQAEAAVRTWLHLACDGDPVRLVRGHLAGSKPPNGQPWDGLSALATGEDPLAGVPFLRTAEGAPMALADLAKVRRDGHRVRYIPPGHPPLKVEPPLVVADRADLELLRAVFGADAVVSGLPAYQEAEQRARFFGLPTARPTIGFHRTAVVGRVPVARHGFRGEVGLRFDRDKRGRDGCYPLPVQLWVEGRPVQVVELASPVPGLIAALEHSDFKANFACTEVEGDRTVLLAKLGPTFAEAMHAMLTRAADEGGSRLRLVRAMIDLVVPTDAHRAAWEALHRAHPPAEAEARYLDILRAGWGSDPDALARPLVENPEAALPAGRSDVVAFTEALLGSAFFADPTATPVQRLLAALPVVGAVPVFSTVEGQDVPLHLLVSAQKPLLHALLARSRPDGYEGPVLLGSGPAVAQLRRLFGADALLSAAEWSKAWAAARIRDALPLHDGRLDRATVLAVHALPGGGEVGLRLPFVEGGRVRIVSQGRLLVDLGTVLTQAVEAVVVADDLEAAITNKGVQIPMEARNRLVDRVLAEIPALYTSLITHLEQRLTPEQEASALAHVRHALVQLARGKARRSDNLASGDVGPLARVELFQVLGGPRRSLLSLSRHREAGHPIWLADRDRRPPRGTTPEKNSIVLLVDAAEREDIKRLFGITLPDFADVVAAADQEALFLNRPPAVVALPGVIAEVPVGKGAFSGRLGLGGLADDRLEVHKLGRLLGVTRLGLGLAGLSAVVNDDKADATGDWTSPQEGPRLDKLRAAVAEQVPALLEAALATPGDGLALRALAWSIVRCAVPTDLWAQLFHTLVDKRGLEKGVDLYHDSLRCLFQDTARSLERIVQPIGIHAEKLMLAESGPRQGRGDAFVRALFGGWPLAGDGTTLVGRLLQRLPALGRVPLVATVGGELRSLAELEAVPGPLVWHLRPPPGLPSAVLVPPKVHWSLLEALFRGRWQQASLPVGPPAPEPVPVRAPVVVLPPTTVEAPIWRDEPPPTPEPTPEPMPEATPEPMPEPMPEAAQPTPEPPPVPPSVQLVERIREILRGAHSHLDLDRLRAAPAGGGTPVTAGPQGIVLDLTHPLVKLALAGADPTWDLFLATLAFGAINRWLEEVEDEHEIAFIQRIAQRLR